MERKKIVRSLITVGLLVALVAVIILSQNHDPSNPHASIPKDTWINGPQGHGYAVNNNKAPAKQCYPCHQKKGLGGQAYCQTCHDQSGVNVSLPES